MAYSLEFLGQMAVEQGHWVRATSTISECLELRRHLGDRRGMAAALLNLGRIAEERDDLQAAWAHYEESLRLWRELGSREGLMNCFRHMGLLAYQQGCCERAAALFEESLARSPERGQQGEIITSLEGLAAACALGQPQRAARLLGASETARERLGASPSVDQRTFTQQAAAAARAALGEGTFAAVRAEGQALSLPQAVAFALEDPGD